jgi:hypothetical protein
MELADIDVSINGYIPSIYPSAQVERDPDDVSLATGSPYQECGGILLNSAFLSYSGAHALAPLSSSSE